MTLSLKASRFIEANRLSPVVYGSVDDHLFTYRLADGSTWTFPRREAPSIGQPRWAHLAEKDRRVLMQHRNEERALLKKVEREANMPSPLG
jgi:hypothetical protein